MESVIAFYISELSVDKCELSADKCELFVAKCKLSVDIQSASYQLIYTVCKLSVDIQYSLQVISLYCICELLL